MASLITGRINDILRILRDVTVTFASVVWEPVRLSGATDRINEETGKLPANSPAYFLAAELIPAGTSCVTGAMEDGISSSKSPRWLD
jgi:hypothetical protein